MITVNLDPETIMYLCLAIAIVLMLYLRFKPDKKQATKHKPRSSKEVQKLKRELARLEKKLKD